MSSITPAPGDGAGYTAAQAPYQPVGWLRELTHLQRSPWPLRRSIRAALCVGTPLAVGLATGHLAWCLWISLAAMISAAGEGAGTYRSRFRQLAIATPIAATGFLLGYLAPLPYPLLILTVAVVGFLSAIVSSYGQPYSGGAMQCLVFGSISIGLPEVGPPVQSMGLFLTGVGFFASVLGVEALVDRRHPQRRLLATYISELATYARLRASQMTRPTDEALVETA